MRKTQYTQVIIMSVDRKELSPTVNEQSRHYFLNELRHVDIVAHCALGYYQGDKEVSYIVLPKDDIEIMLLLELAFKKHKQASVLYQDKHGDAWLWYSTGYKESIGKLRAITGHDETLQDYTVFNGVTYTVKAA